MGRLKLEWKGWIITDMLAMHGIIFVIVEIFGLYDSIRAVKRFYRRTRYLWYWLWYLNCFSTSTVYPYRSVLAKCKYHYY
jgi:hypothetical protein